MHSKFLARRDFWVAPSNSKNLCLFRCLFRIRDNTMESCARNIEDARMEMETWFKGRGVSDAYEFFRPKGEPQFWHIVIWRNYILPRFSITMWFAFYGRLQSVDKIKFSDQPQLCLLCRYHNESHEHLFFKCTKTKKILIYVKWWLKIAGSASTISKAIRYCSRNKVGSGVLRKSRWITLAATVNHI